MPAKRNKARAAAIYLYSNRMAMAGVIRMRRMVRRFASVSTANCSWDRQRTRGVSSNRNVAVQRRHDFVSQLVEPRARRGRRRHAAAFRTPRKFRSHPEPIDFVVDEDRRAVREAEFSENRLYGRLLQLRIRWLISTTWSKSSASCTSSSVA